MDEKSSNKEVNIWGHPVNVFQLESEMGVSGSMHGSALAGAFCSTFTASQGLMLMIPNMYKMAGELLGSVFHVCTRTVGASALSIQSDHSDIMAVRGTGVAMIASSSVQEAHDFALVAHLSSLRSHIPFLHSLDGVRTSAEFNKIEVLELDDVRKMVDPRWMAEYKAKNHLVPDAPVMRGIVLDTDVMMQSAERHSSFHHALPDILREQLASLHHHTGRKYGFFDFFGHPDAERVVVSMGSSCSTIEEVVEELAKSGEKVGLIKVRVFRPWSSSELLAALPKSAKRVAVLDRHKDNLGQTALYSDVVSALYEGKKDVLAVSGRYGLGGKYFTPYNVKQIFENLEQELPKTNFTVGIVDDIMHSHLPPLQKGQQPPVKTQSNSELTDTPTTNTTTECIFWGVGGDGTIGSNQQAIKIIGDATDKFVQGYYENDAKKTRGFTISHLRFGDQPIKSAYPIVAADYVGVHHFTYVKKYGSVLVSRAKKGATMLVCCPWTDLSQVERHFPPSLRRAIAEKNIRLHCIDAEALARRLKLGVFVSMVTQTAFFHLALAKVVPPALAHQSLKDAVLREYARKGDELVTRNMQAIDQTPRELRHISYDRQKWLLNDEKDKDEYGEEIVKADVAKFVADFVKPVNAMRGNDIPVSSVPIGLSTPTNTSRYEKRGVSSIVPEWDAAKCVQCNACAFVCPHAVIRPFLLTDEELRAAPGSLRTAPSKDKRVPFAFAIQPSPYDCQGCSNCVNECPAKALRMAPLEEQLQLGMSENWKFLEALPGKRLKPQLKTDPLSVKGLGFKVPLLEFHGACAGCGEATYVKVLTQMYGENIIFANAAGCTSVWGSYSPSSPYAKDPESGCGPAWASSLFEDNAQYGFGIYQATVARRQYLKMDVENMLKEWTDGKDGMTKALKEELQNWLKVFDSKNDSRLAAAKIKPLLLSSSENPRMQRIIDAKNYFARKSHWIIGGDGWAYDIGIGGVLHTLQTGADIKIIVLNTEVYSNTGGQVSKASPKGSSAKFAMSGKKHPRMDLGQLCMDLGTSYVGSVSMGMSKEHVIKTFKEAEEYEGSSIVFCYSPCIAQGVPQAMSLTQLEEKLVVQSGYWPLYTFNPTREKPLSLDFKNIDTKKLDTIFNTELRFSNIQKLYPKNATKLQGELKKEIIARHQKYLNMESIQGKKQ